MKHKIIICLLALAACGQSLAQDTASKKIKEFYLSVLDLSQMNLQVKYKQQLKEKRFLKLALVDLSYNQTHSAPTGTNTTDTQNYSAGFELGLEFRSDLYKKFVFYHGPGLRYTFNSYTNINKTGSFEQRTTNVVYTAAIPYTLGFLVNIAGHFYVSAELNPIVNYNFVGNGTHSQNVLVSLSNAGLLSFAYRL